MLLGVDSAAVVISTTVFDSAGSLPVAAGDAHPVINDEVRKKNNIYLLMVSNVFKIFPPQISLVIVDTIRTNCTDNDRKISKIVYLT